MDSCKIDFRMDLSLKNLAAIAYAGSFWNTIFQSGRVKELCTEDFWESPDYPVEARDTDKIFSSLMKEFKEKLKAMNLPEILFEHLVQAAFSTGCRMVNWCNILSQLQVPKEYTKTLYWTGTGTIDQVKIVETDWVKSFESEECDKMTKLDIYYMICTLTLKNFIELHCDEILNFCLTNFKEFDGYEEKTKVAFIIYSVLALANASLHLSEKQKNFLLKKYPKIMPMPKAGFMFATSVRRGYDVAARYYWHLLNATEKRKQIMKAAYSCVNDFFDDTTDHFGIDFRADLLVFLLSQMTEDEVRKLIFNPRDQLQDPNMHVLDVLVVFLDTPCTEEVYMKLFAIIKAYSEKGKKFYHYILGDIVRKLSDMPKLGLDIKNNCYRNMFFLVWGEIKKLCTPGCPLLIEEKESFARPFYLYNLMDGNKDILDLILKSECKPEARKRFLKESKKFNKGLTENNPLDAMKYLLTKHI